MSLRKILEEILEIMRSETSEEGESMSAKSILDSVSKKPAHKDESQNEDSNPHHVSSWSVYWVVTDKGRAVLGAPSDKSLGDLIPEDRKLKYGYVVATDLPMEEAKKMVDGIKASHPTIVTSS